jgi:predicted metal-dependent hydrolase
MRRTDLERETRAKREKYENLRRAANKIIRQRKRQYFDEQLKSVDDNFKKQNTRRAYKAVKKLKGGFQAKTWLCRDKDGNTVCKE